MTHRLSLAGIVALALMASVTPARAQGVVVSGQAAAAVSQDITSPALSASVAYRFNRAFGLGVELTHMPDLAGDLRTRGRFDALTMERDTRATMFTTNVRLEIPTISSRIVPYVVGGGGIASVRSEFEVNYLAMDGRLAGMPGIRPALQAPRELSLLPGPPFIGNSRVSMVLTLGGGASFLITDHVSLDADLRVLTLLGTRDRNIGRFGGGVSYRF